MTLNLIATALAAAYLVSPAFAQDAANDTDTRIVSTRGLDLSTSDGIRILDLKLGVQSLTYAVSAPLPIPNGRGICSPAAGTFGST